LLCTFAFLRYQDRLAAEAENGQSLPDYKGASGETGGSGLPSHSITRKRDDRDPTVGQLAKEAGMAIHASLSPPMGSDKAHIQDSSDVERN